MKKKPRIRKTTKKKQPKTRYAVNRKPKSEAEKFQEFMKLDMFWDCWNTALPTVRK